MKALSLAVVGADYPNRRGSSRRFEIEMCSPGEPVSLVREPKNLADPRAIAVFSCRGVQIGYLTAERAPWIGGVMADSREIKAVFQRKTPYGAIVRAAFDGEVPDLPAFPSPEPINSDRFWPDEIYPDE